MGYREMRNPDAAGDTAGKSSEILSTFLRTSLAPIGQADPAGRRPVRVQKEHAMDFVYLALTAGFFWLSWGFVRLCASLEPAREEKR